MKPSLLVLNGHSQETMPFDASWQAHIHTLAHDSLPILALQTTPSPILSLSIERRRSGILPTLLEILFTNGTNSSLSLAWQTFFVTDGSIGETFLLITHPKSSIRLRFGHFRHLPVLEAIAQTGQLAVVRDGGMLVTLSCNASDIQEHLAWIRLSQQTTAQEGLLH